MSSAQFYFIQYESGEDVLVNYGDVISAKRWKNLKGGEQVEVTQVKTNKRWKAVEVERLLVAAIL